MEMSSFFLIFFRASGGCLFSFHFLPHFSRMFMFFGISGDCLFSSASLTDIFFSSAFLADIYFFMLSVFLTGAFF